MQVKWSEETSLDWNDVKCVSIWHLNQSDAMLAICRRIGPRLLSLRLSLELPMHWPSGKDSVDEGPRNGVLGKTTNRLRSGLKLVREQWPASQSVADLSGLVECCPNIETLVIDNPLGEQLLHWRPQVSITEMTEHLLQFRHQTLKKLRFSAFTKLKTLRLPNEYPFSADFVSGTVGIGQYISSEWSHVQSYTVVLCVQHFHSRPFLHRKFEAKILN